MYQSGSKSGAHPGSILIAHHQCRLDEIESVIRTMQDKRVIKSQDHPRVLAGVFFTQYFNIIFLNEFMPEGAFNEDVAINLVKKIMEID